MLQQHRRIAKGLHWFAFALASALLPVPFAQASTNGVNHFSVRIWQTDDGLPHNSVFALAQTGDGYLWIGTHEGLARFDGVRFVVVDDKQAPELRHGYITALCAAKDGSLWIACDGAGLFRLRDGEYSHFSETD